MSGVAPTNVQAEIAAKRAALDEAHIEATGVIEDAQQQILGPGVLESFRVLPSVWLSLPYGPSLSSSTRALS